MRAGIALVGSVSLVGILSGCSATGACDSSGRLDIFSMVVSSASAQHPALRICSTGGCSPIVPDERMASGTAGQGSSAEVRLVATSVDHWNVIIDRGADPATITVIAGRTSPPLATRTLSLAWHRSPQSDSCHTWQTVDLVRLAVP